MNEHLINLTFIFLSNFLIFVQVSSLEIEFLPCCWRRDSSGIATADPDDVHTNILYAQIGQNQWENRPILKLCSLFIITYINHRDLDTN